MLSTEIVEIPACKRAKNPSPAELEKYAITEGGLILQAHQAKNSAGKREQLICLDVRGKNLSTEDLAAKVGEAWTKAKLSNKILTWFYRCDG